MSHELEQQSERETQNDENMVRSVIFWYDRDQKDI